MAGGGGSGEGSRGCGSPKLGLRKIIREPALPLPGVAIINASNLQNTLLGIRNSLRSLD